MLLRNTAITAKNCGTLNAGTIAPVELAKL